MFHYFAFIFFLLVVQSSLQRKFHFGKSGEVNDHIIWSFIILGKLHYIKNIEFYIFAYHVYKPNVAEILKRKDILYKLQSGSYVLCRVPKVVSLNPNPPIENVVITKRFCQGRNNWAQTIENVFNGQNKTSNVNFVPFVFQTRRSSSRKNHPRQRRSRLFHPLPVHSPSAAPYRGENKSCLSRFQGLWNRDLPLKCLNKSKKLYLWISLKQQTCLPA